MKLNPKEETSTNMEWSSFEEKLGSWAPKIKPFFNNGGFDPIYAKLKEDSKRGKVILPPSNLTFRAFQETHYDNLKVVFLLQDPYPWVKEGKVVADGIAMSCSTTNKPQPSLDLFYNGIEDDLYNGLNLHMERNNDLGYLCRQGIMLLNTSLTVEKDKPSSHKEIWKDFTKYFLEEIFQSNSGIIFVMCGKESQQFSRYINPLQHYIFEVEHPAAAAHQSREWKHDKVFSKINTILKQNNNSQVIWDYGEIPF
jgi:uracil-DNA glycosylase